MRSSLIFSLLLICVVLATKSHSKNSQITESLQKLKEFKSGKDALTAIHLELQSKQSPSDQRQNILDILYAMKNSLEGYLAINQQEQIDEDASCDSQINDLNSDINSLNSKINSAHVTDMQFNDQYDGIMALINANLQAISDATTFLTEVELKNMEKVAEFEAAQDEHDNFIAVLNNAKTIVSQLSTSSFLQSTDQTHNHKKYSEGIDKLTKAKNIKFATALVKMTQEVGIQSDQGAVSNIIAIINDLIKAEQDAKTNDQYLEEKRLQMVEVQRTASNRLLDSIGAVQAEFDADLKRNSIQHRQFNEDIQNDSDMSGVKQTMVDNKISDCLQQKRNLLDIEENYQLELGMLDHVIGIFESEDMDVIENNMLI